MLLVQYCERYQPGLLEEPFSLFSNITFFIAAYLVHRYHSKEHDKSKSVYFLTALAVLIGINSSIYHSFNSVASYWADIIPISVFIMFYIYTFSYFVTMKHAYAIAGLAASAVLSFAISFVDIPLLGVGNYYAGTAIVLVAMAVSTPNQKDRPAMFRCAGIFLASLVFRRYDAYWCDTFRSGTHFMWHILNAVLMWNTTAVLIRIIRWRRQFRLLR